jgi:hypothetical protein
VFEERVSLEGTRLQEFVRHHEEMIRIALDALSDAGYDVVRFKDLIWADLPSGFRAM